MWQLVTVNFSDTCNKSCSARNLVSQYGHPCLRLVVTNRITILIETWRDRSANIYIAVLVEDCSKSECPSVIEGIGVISTSKDGRLERGDLNRQGLKKVFSEGQQERWSLHFNV